MLRPLLVRKGRRRRKGCTVDISSRCRRAFSIQEAMAKERRLVAGPLQGVGLNSGKNIFGG